MRLGFISDTHFRTDSGFEPLQRLMGNVDVILSGGDWGVIPFKVGEKLDTPIFSTLGNHDDENVLRAYGILLDEGANKVMGLNVCAIHGTLKTSDRYEDARPFVELLNTLQHYAERDIGICDILIMHEPPSYVYKALARSVPGFGWREDPLSYVYDMIVRLLKPRLVLCGHVHAKQYEYIELPLWVDDIEVVFVPTLMLISTLNDGYAIIDYDEKNRKARSVKIYSRNGLEFSIVPRYRVIVD